MVSPLALAQLAIVVVLAIVILADSLGLLLRWTHPLRVLNSALSSAFILLLLSFAVPMIGLNAIVWLALLGLAMLGVLVAYVRAALQAPPPAHGGDGRGRGRRRAGRTCPPSRIQLAISAVLALAALGAALWAG